MTVRPGATIQEEIREYWSLLVREPDAETSVSRRPARPTEPTASAERSSLSDHSMALRPPSAPGAWADAAPSPSGR